ncbi:hypothetical protein P349_04896 [Enterobacter sp. DC4]|uniref:Tc toxin subunit A-related protein n=1 Tax=Enterobacter sp. DC4 TaxID=1395580 RepID=UPI0003ECEA52|nr:neuraminidase-like domain-containing protein [Enterobacter sp. DC4]EWG65844.1 hypothetical protein P349_04896 [Enterobacter sp. DC4]
MSTTFESTLAEAQRDALVTGYKTFVAPTLNGVSGPISDEDMYEYLLLDMEMSADSMTSLVASAITSLQTYLTRIINNSEPGHAPPVDSVVNEWRNLYCRYDIWAAGTDVVNYPNNYLSPVTRLDVSHYFDKLKNTLNQNQLNSDRVMDAALAYLNEFEGVSNLEVINGYITQTGMSGNENLMNSAKFYFIGRTTAKPYKYYWRLMDLKKNQKEPAGKPVTPNCWNDWAPIDLPLSGEGVVEHTIRPVFYNNRLYVCWATRDATPRAGSGTTIDDHGRIVLDGKEYYAWGLSYAYLRFDGKWTAPNTADMVTNSALTNNAGNDNNNIALSGQLLIQGKDEGDNQMHVGTLITRDTTVEESSLSVGGQVSEDESEYGRLFMSLLVASASKPADVTTFAYRYGDSAFIRRALSSSIRTELFKRFIIPDWDTDGKYRNPLQYALNNLSYSVTSVEHAGTDTHNAADTGDAWLDALADLGRSSFTVADDGRTLTIQAKTSAEIARTRFDAVLTEDNIRPVNGLLCQPDGTTGATIRYDQTENKWYLKNTRLKCHSWGHEAVTNVTLGYNGGKYTALDIHLLAENRSVDISADGHIRWTGGTYSSYLDLDGLEINPAFIDQLMTTTYSNSISLEVYSTAGAVDYAMTEIYNAASILNAAKSGASDPTWEGYIALELFRADGTTKLGRWPDSSQNIIADGYTFTSTPRAIIPSDFTAGAPTLQYVAQVFYEWSAQEGVDAGWVGKNYQVTLESYGKTDIDTPPMLVKRYDSKKGLVQKLAFWSDDLPASTRLNTTFVRELITQANNGLGSLLNYTLQAQKLEADLDTDGASAHIDFDGANGLYFWELFFHLPFMAAWRFASEQQLDEAQTWLHYIFDPSLKDPADSAPDYWNCYPVTLRPATALALSRLDVDPINPDTQAYAYPELYQKAVFMAYVSNLIAQGDAWYRQLTRDTLTQARVLYSQVAELLGPRPDADISTSWVPQTLATLAGGQSATLRAHEHQLAGSNTLTLPALRASYHGTLRDADNAAFIPPLNGMLLSYWDTLDARLYNLRHNLTVDGKPMSLALYEAPANPLVLLAQRAQDGTLTGGGVGAQLVVPPYRFSAVLPRAYNAVSTLSRFGESLLSLLERSERAGQEELAQQQLLDMSSYVLTQQQQAIDGLQADRTALLASQATAQQRYESYYALYQENISAAEAVAMGFHIEAQAMYAVSQDMEVVSGALKELPNIFGLADGGSRYEGATEATGAVLRLGGNILQTTADTMLTAEGYRRRRQEWQIQYQQAESDVAAQGKQLDALDVRIQAAQTALAQEKARQAQTQVMLTYLKTRFTQATLYQWLAGQLSALYYQAYDAVVSLCLSAQACWQYEIGDFTTTFIQTGAWNDHYRGLLVGETLQLNLQQMEAAYLSRYERRLNITRTVSLKDLVTNPDYGGEAQAWDKFKGTVAGGTVGTLSFTLGEKLFDNDYAGHYLRTLKTVSVTLPTLMGPYQDVKAVLTQTGSTTVLSASGDAVATLINGTGTAPGGTLVRNLRASQQIALSGGLNDAGTFELQFNDERYLPFEGTGAVSDWTLRFPRVADKQIDGKTLAADAQQQALLAALDDILFQVHYTACDGGDTFATAVEKLLVPASSAKK